MGSAIEGAREFAADLRAAERNILPEVEKTVFKASMNIKKQLRTEMGRSIHFGKVAAAIDFDIEVSAGGVSAEIGPKPGSPGSLANIPYFGASRGGGGSVPDPELALEAEAPALEKYLGEIMTKGLE